MIHRRHDRPKCRTVTLQLVCDQAEGNLSLPLQELAKEPLCCMTVASRLDEDVDHVDILIHPTPQMLPLTIDGHAYFVQEPGVAETALPFLESPRVVRAELLGPASDGLVGVLSS